MGHLAEYLQYIKNTGRVPLKIEYFDDDWEPIGPRVRQELLRLRLIEEFEGALTLTEEGEKYVRNP